MPNWAPSASMTRTSLARISLLTRAMSDRLYRSDRPNRSRLPPGRSGRIVLLGAWLPIGILLMVACGTPTTYNSSKQEKLQPFGTFVLYSITRSFQRVNNQKSQISGLFNSTLALSNRPPCPKGAEVFVYTLNCDCSIKRLKDCKSAISFATYILPRILQVALDRYKWASTCATI
jgi:hypothetical protein